MGADEGTAGRDRTPTTAGWSGRRLPLSALPGTVFFAVAAPCGLIAAVGGVVERDWVLFVGGAVIALIFGSLLGLLVVASSRGSGAAPTLAQSPGGTSGVRFGYSTIAYFWFTTVLVMCVVVGLIVAVATGTSGSVFGGVVGVVFAGMAVLLAWYLVALLRLAPGELVLSPAGIAHRGLTSLYSVPWSAVQSVEAWRLGTSVIVVKADPSPESVVRRYTGRFDTGELRFLPFLLVRTYWLAADREAVLSALAFYHAHPELRGELATPEAVRRIAEGRTGS